MKLFPSRRLLVYIIGFVTLAIFFTEHAGAAVKLGQIGNNAGESFIGLSSGAQQFAFFGGFVMVIGGLITLMNAKKTNQPLGPSIIAIIIGVLLMSILAFIGSISLTTFGTDESTKSIGDLNLR